MKKEIKGKINVEKLSHFQCSNCNKWWSVGDAPRRNKWFCPWCGKEQSFVKVKLLKK